MKIYRYADCTSDSHWFKAFNLSSSDVNGEYIALSGSGNNLLISKIQ